MVVPRSPRTHGHQTRRRPADGRSPRPRRATVASSRKSSRGPMVIVHSRLESANLAGNLLGDPSERDLFVYLPPGCHEHPDRHYSATNTFLCLRWPGASSDSRLSPTFFGCCKWAPAWIDAHIPRNYAGVLSAILARSSTCSIVSRRPTSVARTTCSSVNDARARSTNSRPGVSSE